MSTNHGFTLFALLTVLNQYFDFESDPWQDADALPQPEDMWRLHRDLKAIIHTEGTS